MRAVIFACSFALAGCNCGNNLPGNWQPADASDPGRGSGAGDGGPHDGGRADGGGGVTDAGVAADGGQGSGDAGNADAGTPDSGSGFDAGSAFDAGGSFDAGPPDAGTALIHIYISNTCVVSTSPASLTAPLHSSLRLTFENDSVDYDADAWSHTWGYGYLGLAKGTSWNDPIAHCDNPNPYTDAWDISIAGGPAPGCPSYRLDIYCQ